jgi:hypothetical protein
MKTLQITPVAKARVWVNERATVGYETDGALGGMARPSARELNGGLMVAVEVLLPRGARAEYGLLGIQFVADTSMRLHCEVAFSAGMNGQLWPDSLAAKLDHVRLGLPKEYASAVLASLLAAVEGRMPSGVVRITDSAHGLVGSSPDLFGRLAAATVELALLQGAEFPNDEAVKLLRRILIG